MVSSIRQLLDEISYEGNAKSYHEGGRGRENVLTAEVFQALDFLPRVPYVDAVLEQSGLTVDDAEALDITVLPGDEQVESLDIRVQPDVLLTSSSHYILVEAKRPKASASFGPKQLYREAVVAEHCAAGRFAALLVVGGSPPPILVAGHGRHPIADAIELGYGIARHESERMPRVIEGSVTIAAITWNDIAHVIMHEATEARRSELSRDKAICRLANAIDDAVRWHSANDSHGPNNSYALRH